MKRLLSISAIFALIILANVQLFSAYCTTSSSTTYGEYISKVTFNTISNSTTGASTGYADYTSSISTTVTPGNNYAMTVNYSYDFGTYYCYVWIDYNNNQTFEDTERTILSNSGSNDTPFTGTVSIPAGVSGTTRMRVYFKYGSGPTACVTGGWGESEDYTVVLETPVPDAQVLTIDNPVMPFPVGNYPVQATIKSNNKFTLTSATLQWSVNGVVQENKPWTGFIANGQTSKVTLGNYNFTYPANGPFSPFNIQVTVLNQNETGQDADNSNNTLSKSVTPILNDAGVMSLVGPDEGFGAGSTPLRVRIKNYAPKVLTEVTVQWKMEGVTQTPVVFKDLAVNYGEVVELALGNYTFYNKTPFAPFAVEAWTEKPNNVTDENTSNDKIVSTLGPSLAPGTYYIGGSGAHFATMSDAMAYYNGSGVIGNGTLNFELRPGTYATQFDFSKALKNNNPIVIKSSTNVPSDVVLEFNSSIPATDNYVGRISNFRNFTIQGVTLQNKKTSRILLVENADNVKIINCYIYGMVNAPKNTPLFGTNACIDMLNTTNVLIENNFISYGSIGINNENTLLDNSIVIKNNQVNNASWMAIRNEAVKANSAKIAQITGNTLGNNMYFPLFGIVASGNSLIDGNIIDGIKGQKASPYEAAILLTGDNTLRDYKTTVANNTIKNIDKVNGIYFKGIEYLAYKNSISGKGLDLATGNPYVHTDPLSPALLVFNEAKGDFGNSMLAGNQITGVKFINAPEANFYYSSVKAESNTYPVISVENQAGVVRRNIFHNPAKSQSIVGNGTIISDENSYWSETSFAKWDNVVYPTINNWAAATNNDLKSTKSFLEFVDLDDLHLNRVVAEIIFTTPIVTVPAVIQDFDFDGNKRISYFGGCDELVLAVHIINQSGNVINCHGSYNTISVTAVVDYDAPSYYQWEKDNAPIQGENKNIIVFEELDYRQSGTYRCRITGPGNTPAVYTNDIKVYALSAPEFIKQPQSVITAKVGNDYEFTAKIHYKGITVPLYDDGFQWFKYTESDKKMVPVVDDERISGSTSTILSIKNLKTTDLCKKGDYYILEVYSLCDTILSDPFIISNAVNIVTKTNPENLSPCPGTDVIFHSEATVPDGYEIEYQWQKDGVDIIDGLKANGATTNKLQLFGVADDDEGGYVCVGTIKGTTISAISKPGILKLKLIPVVDYVTSQKITIKRGKYVEMKGNVIEGTGPITVKWMYKDNLLKEGIWTDVDGDQIMTYSIDTVKEDHAGKYYCIITNDCDEVQLEFVLNVTKWDEANDVAYDSDKNYFLYEVTPNPASSNSAVKFSIPTPTSVNICLTNMNGETVATLANTSFQAGENSVALGHSISTLANGTYFVKLEANGVVLIRKFIVNK